MSGKFYQLPFCPLSIITDTRQLANQNKITGLPIPSCPSVTYSEFEVPENRHYAVVRDYGHTPVVRDLDR